MKHFTEGVTRLELDGMLSMAGFTNCRVWELPNNYWPDCEAYAEIRRKCPWYLVLTNELDGPLIIGPRKRVISISWKDASFRLPIDVHLTSDDTTKDTYFIHAWYYHKAVEYLSLLHTQVYLWNKRKAEEKASDEAVAEAIRESVR